MKWLGWVIGILSAAIMCSVAALGAAERATPVREANLYLSPDASSAKLAEVERLLSTSPPAPSGNS